jgi:lysine 2,3-aminomutase
MTWQEEIRDAVRSVEEMEGYAFLRERRSARPVEERFRTLVSRYYLGLIDPVDPEDPIAKMAFPAAEEVSEPVAGVRDPIGDLVRQAAPRLTHRYPDRALLHVTNLCPMYCRFCFRKNLMNEREEELYLGDFEPAFAYLAAHPEVEELILSGGDPWMLSDARLSELVGAIAARLPAVKRLRFHTRMPVTLPSRVTHGLLEALASAGEGRFRVFVVTHFNHPRELSAAARAGLARLRSAGLVVLNQSVLLKGVNDSAAVLKELFVGLGNEGVLPYYLHHCDLVDGAEHFRLPLAEGRRIWASLRGTLAGYLLPEYVLDTPGGIGKVPVSSKDFVQEMGPGLYRVTRGGQIYLYADPQPRAADGSRLKVCEK